VRILIRVVFPEKCQANINIACIGPHLAQIELALAAAVFFRECSNAQVAPSMKDGDMEPIDLFVVSPRGQRCMVIM
jgi:hypothetical protein